MGPDGVKTYSNALVVRSTVSGHGHRPKWVNDVATWLRTRLVCQCCSLRLKATR